MYRASTSGSSSRSTLMAHVLLVEQPGDGRVLEALPLHDVAPVAGGVADAQEDRPAGAPGLGEGLGAPRPPVDGILAVGAQVGTVGRGEAVAEGPGGAGMLGGVQRHAPL